jgi:hypothetical protein
MLAGFHGGWVGAAETCAGAAIGRSMTRILKQYQKLA